MEGLWLTDTFCTWQFYDYLGHDCYSPLNPHLLAPSPWVLLPQGLTVAEVLSPHPDVLVLGYQNLRFTLVDSALLDPWAGPGSPCSPVKLLQAQLEPGGPCVMASEHLVSLPAREQWSLIKSALPVSCREQVDGTLKVAWDTYFQCGFGSLSSPHWTSDSTSIKGGA